MNAPKRKKRISVVTLLRVSGGFGPFCSYLIEKDRLTPFSLIGDQVDLLINENLPLIHVSDCAVVASGLRI